MGNPKMPEGLLANRYKVIEKIGQGGMGIIWRVSDTMEHREVALKQFYKKEEPEDFQTQEYIGLSTVSTASTESDLRFKQEFRTMVKLKHPNTVNVYDYGFLGSGEDYITMELVPGEGLGDILKKRQLNLSEICRILIQIAQVLNFIHSRLLVHRDIKPANIHITPEGNVKLMDFGLMDPMGLPSKGETTGTVIYLPPEVALGGIIDARSDLYSLGVMAYELIAGRPPFVGEKLLDIIRQHIEEPPLPPRQIRKDIPEDLEKIVLKLLAKDQNERYQTTAELINDLVKLTDEKIAVETFEQRKSYLNCSELIGRDQEMRKLKDAFSLARKTEGQSTFVAAPAGVGKSRLVQEFKLKAQLAEIPFIQGRCFEQGMSTYQPMTEALRQLLPLTKKGTIDKYGPVLVKIMPELKSKGYSPAPDLDPYAEKARLLEYVTNWIKEITELKAIAIYVEDLHWADLASVELLNGCIRGLSHSAVMVIGSFRDDEVEATHSIFQTVEEELTTVIKLTPLNQESVKVLIERMLGQAELSDDFVEHMFTATGGNPFFVSEAMRGLIEEEKLSIDRGRWILPIDISKLEFPSSIEDTVLRRLKLLSEDSLKLARIAAAAGRNLDLSFLKELSGLKEDKLFDILDELTERQFMKFVGRQYLFTHDRVRETLYGQLSEEEREKFHQLTGIILEQRHAENLDEIASELGYHFNLGTDKEKAIKYLLIAGEHSFERGNFITACAFFKQALYWLGQVEYPNGDNLLLIYRDRILETSYGSDPQLCLETARKQLDDLLYSDKFRVETTLIVLNAFFRILTWVLPTRMADSIKVKLGTRSKPGATDFSANIKIKNDLGELVNLIARTIGYSIVALSLLGRVDECFEEIKRFFKFFADRNAPYFVSITLGSIMVYLFTGHYVKYSKDLAHAIVVEERQKWIWEKINRRIDWYGLGMLYQNSVNYTTWIGKKFDEDDLKKAMKICKEWGFIDGEFWLHMSLGRWYAFAGCNKEYRETLEKLMETSKKMGRPAPSEIWAYEYMVRFALDQHDFSTAEKWNSKLDYASSKLNNQFFNGLSKIHSAVLLFNKGESGKAISILKKAIEASRKGKFVILVEGLHRLGEILLEMNNLNEAEEILKDALKSNASFEAEHLFWTARTYRVLGQVYRKKKEFEKAKEYFEKSLSVAEKEGYVLETGRTFLSICELCMDLTQYSSAREVLQKAKRKFQEADSKYFLDKTDKLESTLPAKAI